MAWQAWLRGALVLCSAAAAACSGPDPARSPGDRDAGAEDGGSWISAAEPLAEDAGAEIAEAAPIVRAPADPPEPLSRHIEVTLPVPGELANSRAVPGLLLTYPYCIPDCTLADRPRLMADTSIEDRYVRVIEDAAGTVDFSTFTFGRPRILHALIDAAERGVRVRGVVDRSQLPVTEGLCSPSGCRLPMPLGSPEILAMSPRRRFEYIESNGLWPQGASLSDQLAIVLAGSANGSGMRRAAGQRLVHNKLVLADGEVLVGGSPNWSSTGLAINLETIETATLESDPELVRAFACMFEAVFTGDPQVIQRRLQACQTERVFFSPMPALKGVLPTILRSIDDADDAIDIAMHHFTSPEITSALVRARQRGVKVRMLFDDDDCVVRTPEDIRTLGRAGALIRHLGTSCDMFQLQHDKFGVFDGRRVIYGPANWTKAGIVANYESFIVHERAAYVGAFGELFERAWAAALPRESCGCNPRDPACRARFCLDRPTPH